MDEQSSEKKSTAKIVRETFREFAPYATLGAQLGFTVIVFFAIGWWVDSELATDPWGKILGVFLGAAGGLVKFFQSVKEILKNNGKDVSH